MKYFGAFWLRRAALALPCVFAAGCTVVGAAADVVTLGAVRKEGKGRGFLEMGAAIDKATWMKLFESGKTKEQSSPGASPPATRHARDAGADDSAAHDGHGASPAAPGARGAALPAGPVAPDNDHGDALLMEGLVTQVPQGARIGMGRIRCVDCEDVIDYLGEYYRNRYLTTLAGEMVTHEVEVLSPLDAEAMLDAAAGQHHDAYDERTIPTLGKVSGFQFLLVGELFHGHAEHGGADVLFLRLFQLETHKVCWAAKQQVRQDAMALDLVRRHHEKHETGHEDRK